jgi:hypothetical protein
MIARLFPLILSKSCEGQRKLWMAEIFQLASVLAACEGLMAARIGQDSSSAGLVGAWVGFVEKGR